MGEVYEKAITGRGEKLNIENVIKYLNKELKYDISSSYYEHIKKWDDWWRGFYKPFHEFTEVNGSHTKKRELYSLKMAKKVCEDWASLLLNEKTQIVVDDATSSTFLLGEDDEAGEAGVLGNNDFWKDGNALVEKAFYSGTGAIVLRFDGMVIKNGAVTRNPNTKIRIECLPAMNIVPLTVKQKKIVDVAFVSEVLVKGNKFTYIETHIKEADGYHITNAYFKDDHGILKPQPLPKGIAPLINTGSDIPLFVVVKPNIVNNIDDSTGLGISVYANAIDALKGVDLAYNNFNRDFKLGGKKVFINEDLTAQDENGNTITPDDVAQQLFISTGDGFLDKNGNNNKICEYNPLLRVAENKEGIQGQLDYLSFKVGLGTKHYQFNAGSIVTATQYMGDKQELVQNASKHYIVLSKALKDLVKAILWAGNEICGQPVKPDAKVSIIFDDSYIIDKESERLRDQQEVRDGLMNKWEYRVKWYGEDKNTAKNMVADEQTDNELMDFKKG